MKIIGHRMTQQHYHVPLGKKYCFWAHSFIYSFIIILSQITAAGFALLLVFPDLVATTDLVSDHLLDAHVLMQQLLYLYMNNKSRAMFKDAVYE